MIDLQKLLGFLFAVLLTALFLLFYGCSASYHINKAIKKQVIKLRVLKVLMKILNLKHHFGT